MSKISDYIKSRNGRTSSKLVQSFQKFLAAGDISSVPNNWDAFYPEWIKTVKQRPLTSYQDEITTEKLYRTIESMAQEIARLKVELAMCQKNLRHKAPPASVLNALAVYGD